MSHVNAPIMGRLSPIMNECIYSTIIYLKCVEKSVALPWSIESLPSNPAAPVRFLAGSGILMSVFCPCFVLCCLRRRPWHCAGPHIQGGPPLCICLQSMRNTLRQNFEERQKIYLPSLPHSCYYGLTTLVLPSPPSL